MLALGIDPGTAICGYGLVEMKGNHLKAIDYGAVITSPKMSAQDRLLKINLEIEALIKKYQPDEYQNCYSGRAS